jgi:flavin reductase (DIM6/NTAB) family NADH-FMN oxidoreductase RutF
MSIDTREFRNALGSFATGIVVVTAGQAGQERGITVNSFTSVSLDPPLVLWCIAKSSRRYEAFTKTGKFTVSVLGKSGRAVAEAVASSPDGSLGAVETETLGAGPPAIAGALAAFGCRQEALHDGGDHVVIVGRVEAMRYGDGAPLVFFRGSYAELAG